MVNEWKLIFTNVTNVCMFFFLGFGFDRLWTFSFFVYIYIAVDKTTTTKRANGSMGKNVSSSYNRITRARQIGKPISKSSLTSSSSATSAVAHKRVLQKYRKCPYCFGLFYKSNISRHISQIHTQMLLQDGKTLFQCSICRIIYRNLGSFQSHMKRNHWNTELKIKIICSRSVDSLEKQEQFQFMCR